MPLSTRSGKPSSRRWQSTGASTSARQNSACGCSTQSAAPSAARFTAPHMRSQSTFRSKGSRRLVQARNIRASVLA
eukprot:6188090-Pleurochrysis_carterae.AAC.4